MTTKALDVWKNANPKDRKFVLCELSIAMDSVLDGGECFGFSERGSKRCSAVVRAARTVLKQIANGEIVTGSLLRKVSGKNQKR